jgi:hypothetical protein
MRFATGKRFVLCWFFMCDVGVLVVDSCIPLVRFASRKVFNSHTHNSLCTSILHQTSLYGKGMVEGSKKKSGMSCYAVTGAISGLSPLENGETISPYCD